MTQAAAGGGQMASALEDAGVESAMAAAATAAPPAPETPETPEPPPAPGENDKQRFMRLAPPRVDKIIKAIDVLENLCSGNYEYTETQVEKMFARLQRKLNKTHDKFRGEDDSFTFDEEPGGLGEPAGGQGSFPLGGAGIGGEGSLSEDGGASEIAQQPAGTAEAIGNNGDSPEQ